MKKFDCEAEIRAFVHAYVDAENKSVAQQLGLDLGNKKIEELVSSITSKGNPALITIRFANVRACQVAECGDENEEIRTSTYVCFHCGNSTLKTMWGPGWIRCPLCNKIAPSAKEQQCSPRG